MKYRFECLPYRRKFVRPFMTARGAWEYREGIIIRLEQEGGAYGFGEVAPVPWFGTETFDRAHGWCLEQDGWIQSSDALPADLPCCQWALCSAQAAIEDLEYERTFPIAGLVTDSESLAEKQAAGFQTFKIKVGVKDVASEQGLVETFVSGLGAGQRLRLDANGGLSERDFKEWLEFLEGQPVEFFEQPMERGLENRMLEIAEPFSTTVALDESIAGLNSLLHWRNWPGVLVVKPSFLGWIGDAQLPDLVGSSAFETAFGFEGNLRFLARHQQTGTAIGFDTNALLEDDGWTLHGSGASLAVGEVTNARLQALWEDMR